MNFIADEMVGKLARWLRMAGFDVVYANPMDDDFLLTMARKTARLVLTRDTKLVRHLQPEEFLFIQSDYLDDQIKELLSCHSEMRGMLNPFSRCVECNTPLQPISKEDVRGKVWPYVYGTQEVFTECLTCKRVYWKATHVTRIRSRLEQLFGITDRGLK